MSCCSANGCVSSETAVYITGTLITRVFPKWFCDHVPQIVVDFPDSAMMTFNHATTEHVTKLVNSLIVYYNGKTVPQFAKDIIIEAMRRCCLQWHYDRVDNDVIEAAIAPLAKLGIKSF